MCLAVLGQNLARAAFQSFGILGPKPPCLFPFYFLRKTFFTSRLIRWSHELLSALTFLPDQDLAVGCYDFLRLAADRERTVC